MRSKARRSRPEPRYLPTLSLAEGTELLVIPEPEPDKAPARRTVPEPELYEGMPGGAAFPYGDHAASAFGSPFATSSWEQQRQLELLEAMVRQRDREIEAEIAAEQAVEAADKEL